MFRLIEENLTRLELVGFVYEHGENFELVLARSVPVVSVSGKIV